MILKQKTQLLISSGSYEDYSNLGLFEIVKEFNPTDAENEFYIEHPEARQSLQFDSDAFLNFLLAKGYVKSLPCAELSLKGYGTENVACYKAML